MNISDDMLMDAARARSNGETWAAIGRQWGTSGQTAKRAYLRKSRETYSDKPYCSVCMSNHYAHTPHTVWS